MNVVKRKTWKNGSLILYKNDVRAFIGLYSKKKLVKLFTFENLESATNKFNELSSRADELTNDVTFKLFSEID